MNSAEYGIRKNPIAPEGYLWLCPHCGKTSKSVYGYEEEYPGMTSYGWDASCALNAALASVEEIKTKAKQNETKSN